MKISEKLMKEMNEQLNFELESGYIYKGMESYFAKCGYDGFRHFMKLQAEEEYEHHQKFFDFISDISGEVEYRELKKPSCDYKDAKEAIEKAYAHEQEVTKRIKNLYKMGLEEGAYEVVEFLSWFIKEQVEEEATFEGILDRYELLDDAKTTTYFIDMELGKRE